MRVIKCTPREFEENFRKHQGLLTRESRFIEVPNSLGGRNHIQFTVMIEGNKQTFFVDRTRYPKYEGLF